MRVVVGNRRRGGGWWRLGLVVIGWLMIAAPTIVAALVVTRVRAIARALPPPPDLAAWQATAPRTSTLVARDGTTLTTLPFLDGAVVGNRQVVPDASVGTLVPFWEPAAFEEAVVAAVGRDWDRDALRRYAASNGWDVRVDAVLDALRRLVSR